MRKQDKIFCNCCGKKILIQNGMEAEGVCTIRTKWGYFSNKDGEQHSFELCEGCYDKWTAGFAFAPEITEQTELL